jgi:hypothetical protein
MRIGIVRTDISKIYLSDVENSSQRNFSSEPRGQSRYFLKPSDSMIDLVLSQNVILSVRGTDLNATVNTAANNSLRVRTKATDPFTVLVVTTGAVVAKTTIANDLNLLFISTGLPLSATVTGANELQIDSTTTNMGPSAYIEFDSLANGSTLNTVVGFNAAGQVYTGLSVAAFKTAVYPTATTINVSSANISALSTLALLTPTQLSTLVETLAELIAPKLVETGPVLLSFAYGILSKLRNTSFQPGGPRIALPAGVAAHILEDDGLTTFTL